MWGAPAWHMPTWFCEYERKPGPSPELLGANEQSPELPETCPMGPMGPMSTRASGIKVVRGEESLRFCRGVSCWGKKRLRVPSDVSDGLTSAHAPGRERGEY